MHDSVWIKPVEISVGRHSHFYFKLLISVCFVVA
jgi:hypothetical protein